MEDNLEQIALQIITISGIAKSEAFEALKLARKSKYEESSKAIERADQKITESHIVHTKLITGDYECKSYREQLLINHAMDTLMTSMSEINLIKEIIEILKERAI